MAASEEEHRKHIRHVCDMRMTYTILSSTDSTPFEYGIANAKNLSEAGVCIFTEQEIQAPVLMQLNISLPVRPFHMLILGKALRCEPATDSDLYEIGLKFVGILPPEFRGLISEIGLSSDQDPTPAENA